MILNQLQKHVLESIFSTLTKVIFNEDRIGDYIYDSCSIRDGIKAKFAGLLNVADGAENENNNSENNDNDNNHNQDSSNKKRRKRKKNRNRDGDNDSDRTKENENKIDEIET